MRQVISTAEDPDALHIKTEYDGPVQRLDLNKRKRLSNSDFVDACRVTLKKGIPKPGIPEAKKQDLVNICLSDQIPATYHEFYFSQSVGGDIDEEPE